MILQELKKLFEIKRLLLILLLGILFYILFFHKNVGIPVYSSERINLEVSLDLKEKYGYELDQNEYKQLLNNSNQTEESKIDEWIKANEDFKKNQIANYRELLANQDSLPDKIAGSLIGQIATEFTEKQQQSALDNIWRVDYVKSIVEVYDTETKSNTSEFYNADKLNKSSKRIEERNQKEVYSLMPDVVMRIYLTILPDFAIFLFLSIILLIVPYSVKDTMEGITVLQYASQKGCKFYWKKTIAVFISSFVLSVIETGLLLIMINKNNAFSFVNCYVSGFQNPFITFMKLTFGQYMFMSLFYIILIGLCLSMITYWISSYTNNYISAIAFQIPIIIFSIVISLTIMSQFAEITQNIGLLYVIPSMCILMAITGNTIRFILIRFYEHV